MSDVPARRDDRVHVVPARVQTFGMSLFLVTLTILFAACMLAYVFIRLRGQGMPPPGALRPTLRDPLLFLSTGLVVLASLAVHVAVLRVRRERQDAFLRWLFATDLLALAFVAVQTPAIWGLVSRDPGVGPAPGQLGVRDTRLFTIAALFIAIHAAHVLGGIVYLAVVTRRALAGRYDHEHYTGVRHAAMYWHFLDLVWLCMFGTFLYVG